MLASSSTVKTYCTSKLAFEQPEKHSFRKLETIFTKVRKDFYFIFFAVRRSYHCQMDILIILKKKRLTETFFFLGRFNAHEEVTRKQR